MRSVRFIPQNTNILPWCAVGRILNDRLWSKLYFTIFAFEQNDSAILIRR